MAQLKPPSATPLAGGGFARPPLGMLVVSVAAAMTVACSPSVEHDDTTEVATTTASCLGAAPGKAIRLRADSIGILPTQLTFAELRTRCPGSRDTTVRGADRPEAAVVIPAPAGTAVLAIWTGSSHITRADWPTVLANRRPDLWNVGGSAIELPGGVPGYSRWGHLVRQYGPALVYRSGTRAGAIFCRLPDLEFTLDAPAFDTTRSHLLDSLSTQIPGTAGVENITVTPRTPQPIYKECGGTGSYLAPDGEERHAAAQSRNAVRRVGDTLFIRATNGSLVTLIDRPRTDDMQIAYTYVGTIANGTLHQVAVEGIEYGWTEYFTAATGRRFVMVGDPIMSPDGTRIASSFYALDVCEGTARLEIFRLTASIPALEFEIEPRDCIAETGWAPHDLQWVSADTLGFLADSDRATNTPMLAVRQGATWRIVPGR